jgi:hypothetical protein
MTAAFALAGMPGFAEDFIGFGFFTTGLDDGQRSDWSIEITNRNSLIVTNTRSGEMTSLGPLRMEAEDGESLWDLVHRARFERREDNVRVQQFKEVLFTFITVDETERRSFILWREDAVRDRRLRLLVQGIEEIIQTYAGTAPKIL